MGDREISNYLAGIGKRGGQATAKKLTLEQRRVIAIKASKAAAKARMLKAAKRENKK